MDSIPISAVQMTCFSPPLCPLLEKIARQIGINSECLTKLQHPIKDYFLPELWFNNCLHWSAQVRFIAKIDFSNGLLCLSVNLALCAGCRELPSVWLHFYQVRGIKRALLNLSNRWGMQGGEQISDLVGVSSPCGLLHSQLSSKLVCWR